MTLKNNKWGYFLVKQQHSTYGQKKKKKKKKKKKRNQSKKVLLNKNLMLKTVVRLVHRLYTKYIIRGLVLYFSEIKLLAQFKKNIIF